MMLPASFVILTVAPFSAIAAPLFVIPSHRTTVAPFHAFPTATVVESLIPIVLPTMITIATPNLGPVVWKRQEEGGELLVDGGIAAGEAAAAAGPEIAAGVEAAADAVNVGFDGADAALTAFEHKGTIQNAANTVADDAKSAASTVANGAKTAANDIKNFISSWKRQEIASMQASHQGLASGVLAQLLAEEHLN